MSEKSFANRFQTVAHLAVVLQQLLVLHRCASSMCFIECFARFTGLRWRAHWLRVLLASAWSWNSTQRDGWWCPTRLASAWSLWSVWISTQRNGWWCPTRLFKAWFTRCLLKRQPFYAALPFMQNLLDIIDFINLSYWYLLTCSGLWPSLDRVNGA